MPALLSSGTENRQEPDRQDIVRDTEAVPPKGANKLGGEGTSATNALFEINAGSSKSYVAVGDCGRFFLFGDRLEEASDIECKW